MDTIEFYRNAIQSLLTAYAAIPIANGVIDCYTVFDPKQDHYQVMNVGWDGLRRVYGCVLHLDIKEGKIWIEQNMTEMRVAQELVDLGVAKGDIVLGFQAPQMREYTDYGVA
ncbi:XisI protein [Rivularia sp. UHCC 0363]|uniref:XisI protein n=1 Tax=Rivularia sp. UHCC 0363 TaxID=3110244 RepID=UPI002B208297|nr:XisI protein [Rivularia sp. UHCC 0363]MEA5593291.1 XisI protein [Rivularia sp. UHCC 0363]